MNILLNLFIKLSAFSAIAFGGVNALLPELYRLSVTQEHWLNTQTFSDFFAIAQAAPGPNLMTVILIGWHVGGVLGAAVASVAICWPSSIMIYFLQNYLNKISNQRVKSTIQLAASALAVGLVLGSAWDISNQIHQGMPAIALTSGAILILLLTRWHPLYLIIVGALLGVLGLI
ncbi:chromate transporter [Polynucleobacter meluiroseus]|uniref:Chromate transporter n=1 Tax=Polynucleobacter meluiroseus TaxID=1938814 RepID=A0A240DY53_9BURK|nr:chromate transporter [Polynucleobacter meluiroseus]SNX28129.1 chromate transporter [Polynucleobacter meluiroseus]